MPESIITKIDESSLLMRQLEEIDALKPRRPRRWSDYIYAIDEGQPIDHGRLNSEFPLTLPFAIIDPRIMDLALAFPENPDGSLVSAFRRLEDFVRKKGELETESSTRLFTKAFQGDTPVLVWEGVEGSERSARATLFDAIYRAYRNPRAHRERPQDLAAAVREFLLVNELFLLEAQCVKQDTSSIA